MSDTVIDNPTTEPAGQEQEREFVGVELTEALDSAVRAAVAGDVTAAAKTFSKGALDQVLTEEVVAAMQQLALREAAAAVDPAQEPVEKPRKLIYRNLEEFVTRHIAHLYRRDVPTRNADSTPRWCPCWWEHGEAVSRLGALWRAFEHLRHGESVEMNVWWLQYADPQMDRLMDPEGPFKYCSVDSGHSPKLTKLPTVAAPEGVLPDGHAHDNPAASTPTSSSSLFVPSPPVGNRRVIVEFPG
ncbi:DUF4913 domain-containing protein [Nocardia gipuzkoensis]|uniref:DUF4913 domain-containing protein n=1 Tax=Nocardia gipuzkoensis TaxID=2749991 RepID=UPI00237D983C|nr:DUF4913 domain-containing protein [Nocardia gipuzkoensis]MDE1674708.1 DUF4913 domain-containing protein [Nocardia gipuzkoensis]